MAFSILLQSEYIIPVVTFIVALVYIIRIWTQNLPPGPTALPIIGNLYGMTPDNMVEILRENRKKYGDIYRLMFGSKTVVIVNGYETLKDVFVKNADVTSDRPDLFLFNLFEGHGMLTVSGELWKEHRTFALSKLRNFGFGKKTFESKIHEEVNALLTALEETKGCDFNMRSLIQTCISNVICSVVFGKRFEHTDQVFVKLMDIFDELANIGGLAGPLNFIPVIKYLPGDPFAYHRIVHNKKEMDSFVSQIIQEHEETYEFGNQRDFIDAFLDEKAMKGENSGNTFSDKQLLHVVEEFFAAGTETTATSLRWAMLFLLKYPEMQDRMRKEIESVVGMSRLPSYADRSSLHFCQAFITEVFRCGGILPFSLMHATSRDFLYRGYVIPKGTLLMPNLESVMMDRENFTDPSVFNPNRYLDEHGHFENNDRVMPFSLGRRSCLGESLARMEFFLFLTAIVQRFNLFPEKGKAAPPITGKLGVTYSPNPYLLRAEKIA